MRHAIGFSLVMLVVAAIPTSTKQVSVGRNSQTVSVPRLSQNDKQAVELAIVDEMYANGLQGYAADVGTEIPDSAYQLTAYFQPTLNKENASWVIYKLMPYGEVYRLFAIEPNGLAVLYGRLQNRFPPTEPSYLTVYMNDDDLCRMKKEWGKSHFTVELKPSRRRIAEARARQQKRKAY